VLRHPPGGQDELGIRPVVHRPADHLALELAENDGRVSLPVGQL